MPLAGRGKALGLFDQPARLVIWGTLDVK